MIDLAAIRTVLGDALDAGRETSGVARVYRRAINGTFQAPAVVIGQPAIEEPDVMPCSVDRWSWPVHVAVGRPGADEEATQSVLESTWIAVYRQLHELLLADLPGTYNATVTRADFGSLMVAGTAYPAYEITLEIVG